jgi:hypothetical protein
VDAFIVRSYQCRAKQSQQTAATMMAPTTNHE